MKTDPGRANPFSSTAERVDHRTLRRRQFGVLRNTLLTLLVIGTLIVLLVLNRDEVAIRGCKERMELACDVLRGRQALEMATMTTLPDPVAPYDTEQHRTAITTLRTHALYNLLYGRQSLSDPEVGVCACRFPHTRLFGETGRWVVVFRRATRSYDLEWIDETDFRAQRKQLGFTDSLPRVNSKP